MSTKILDEISEILNEMERYWIKGKLVNQLVIEDLRNNDSKLISKLLSNQTINEIYVQDIDGYKLFDKEAFISMLRYKNYWQDSYTKYANKIGLTTENQYLNYNSDVILDFPFKDCILEGAVTKEDSILKNDEKFYNQVIAREEIDTLLSTKAFTNIKKYNEDGKHDVNYIEDTDNLIIRGNNLIALHSLKKKYANKINLIYIDPPYNTGGDSFKYNDRFNRASWLTFMKNRLEVAKELLSDEGSIFVQIDWHEAHYLKILLDSIFGEKNLVNEIIWSYSSGGNYTNSFPKKHDTIFWYSKSDNYHFYAENKMVGERRGKDKKNNMKKNIDENGSIYYSIKSNGKEYRYYEDDIVVPQDVWDIPILQQKDPERLSFNSQKPERLISRIIGATTNEKDLILDFFMGSATTQAVAHKMKRQYIGIEQMNYINTISVPRLQKVIKGDQSGISKDLEWQGGGSFVYAELAKENQDIVDKIINSNTKEELNEQIDALLSNGVLNYEVDFNEFINTKKEFNELKLEDQKEVLIRVLDSNQLYVNYSDIEDTAYNFTVDEIAFNHSFYGGE